MKNIEFYIKEKKFTLSNSWEELSPEQYEALISDVQLFAEGKLSAAMVKVNYVCRSLGIQRKHIKDEDAVCNLAWLSEQVTFPFVIVYPDNDAALEGLDPEMKTKFKRIPPERMNGHALARYLSKLEYSFALDGSFCAQLVPVIKVGAKLYKGYKIDASFNVLTCSLTALQYIEAREVMAANNLPLLAAILYSSQPYSSDNAQQLAAEFNKLSQSTLQAIAFNFMAFNNFLFKKTDYSILTEGSSENKPISTGALESLYNLSADGLGNSDEVEQMNLIKYLTIMRKKLIESVKSLKAANMDNAKISEETGLPIHLITKI